MKCTTAAGTAYTLADSAAKAPSRKVEKVIDAAAKFIGPGADLFVSDRNHGDVETKGAWCLAHEGAYEWPGLFTVAQHDKRTVPADLFIEPGTGWWLGVYPAA